MATTKSSRRRGLIGTAGNKTPCIAASTANLTLSGEQTVDGIALVGVSLSQPIENRCLVKNQTVGAENGIYVVSTGAWQRSKDWDGKEDIVEGTMIPVNRGTSNEDTFWRITTTGDITIDTTSVTIERSNFQIYSEVNTMTSLLTADTTTGVVIVLGFHTKGDGGGGEFFYDSTANKNTHNGGTIIDPDNAADLATWDASAKTTWFTAGSGTGCWKRKVSTPLNVKWFGAMGDGSEDDTAVIQETVDVAYAAGTGGAYLPDGSYIIYGTITVKAGVTLFGDTLASEYYPGEGASAIDGAELLKPAASSSAGAIVILDTAGGLHNVYLKHLKLVGADTGILQIGAVGTSVTCYNTNTSNVRIYGVVNDDIDGTGTHYGIYFPPSDTGTAKQRYFNKFDNVFITNVDVAIRLNENSNGNVFSNIITRSCIYHYELDGGSGGVTDNVFSGIGLFNIGSISAGIQEICFRLQNSTTFNVFAGYQTECLAKAFDIDSTSSLNYFSGQENETVASFVPPGGITGEDTGSKHSRWQSPINIEQYTQMLLPTLATGGRYDTPGGCRVSMCQVVNGTANGLPALNDAVGTLVAADPDSRVIVQFNATTMKKSVEPNFRCKLTVIVRSSGTVGQTMATVEFSYIVTNTSTDAGLLSVHNVDINPASSNFITGLYFIDGATGGTEFRIGMVGGNVSATVADAVIVFLDIDIYKVSEVAKKDFANIGFISTAASANDVTDAIDLLTVAATVV